MMCFHCLEEGEWEDDDKCPSCATAGHVSPWEVSKCPVCNAEYYAKMEDLEKRIGMRPVCRQCKEKDELIKNLERVCCQVEEWWLSDGMKNFQGAPWCIFDLRALLAAIDRAKYSRAVSQLDYLTIVENERNVNNG